MEANPSAEQQEISEAASSDWRRIHSSLYWIVLVALLLRLSWIIVGHTYKFKAIDNNFSFGWEMGRIGAAIASGQGFSNPFGAQSGSTAWEPPLYPYLVAGVFRVFGIYSRPSAFVLLAINSAFSALTCIPIFLAARRIFSEKVAVAAAWAWALLPNVMFWSTRAVWETSLAGLLLANVVWLALRLEDQEGWLPWLQFGLLWGIAALSSTSLLSFLPAAGLWIWYRRARAHKRSVGGIVLASAVFLACITPWILRNHATFGRWIFIRDNFGAELRLGNGTGGNGTWMEYLHPTQDVYAMRQYESMGELAYIDMRKEQAIDYIKADYARFAGLCLKRFIYFWAGPPKATQPPWLNEAKNSLYLASSILTFWGLARALRMRRPGTWLVFWLLAIYPAVYYVVFPSPRYRVPIEPVMTILCVFVITEAGKKVTAGAPHRS